MTIPAALHRQYINLVNHWPIDPLRPTVSFQNMLADRVERYFGTHAQADETIPTQNTPLRAETIAKEGAHEAVAKPVVKFDQALIEKEINVLGNLLEDRFKKAYPVSDTMLKPKSNPEYYEKLLQELDEAPSRSWWQAQINSWKGYIRFQ
ncbi:hypothetical protein FPQ18DRAFT_336129 [Pyronema domesticum]|uniref:Similar to Cytochrome B pre-mRNA-processing protein 6 acc. no. P07253 n=1 Tax=Pyronema omphalodes (strain CBS 100304) TaxID=1076935 RepID=U4L1J3_PYROM|nr:hypothetical protein FPQ18DRAFT_336129 [Pyronema domesticum]CCX09296.1 Similar to Cytochrome B pre-mRNA-processing protein 6; acc. no. P07253 [Pyronema omphalodes CBS 100304]